MRQFASKLFMRKISNLEIYWSRPVNVDSSSSRSNSRRVQHVATVQEQTTEDNRLFRRRERRIANQSASLELEQLEVVDIEEML